MDPHTNPPLFLGLDLSTQSLTALAVDSEGNLAFQASRNFDECFPAYGTSGGVLTNPDDPTEVHGSPLLWVEALEAMMGLLQHAGVSPRVAAVAVSAQQHGSVYLKPAFADLLRHLAAMPSLKEAVAGAIARPTAPVWMDSSTSEECAAITVALGGADRVAALTGSVATERFAGPQIRRFAQRDPAAYAATGHVALISSFVTSLLAGRVAPLDGGDGYGANLADIRTGKWSPEALDATAAGLAEKLPPLVPKDVVVGPLASYWTERYGFSPETLVVTGSGDNPCSLVGLGLLGDERTRAISLGTSDTLFGYRRTLDAAPRTEGHLFGTADGGYMSLLCFKNGSLARQRVRDDFGLSWEEFSGILLATPPGNEGKGMLPWFLPEITPVVLQPGARFFGGLSPTDARGCVRAVAEAQACALRLHAEWMGEKPERLLVTAGGSENQGLLQVLADVFGVPVQTLSVKDSAALGAALRAEHAYLAASGTPKAWEDLCAPFAVPSGETVRPRPDAAAVYEGAEGFLARYAAAEKEALES